MLAGALYAVGVFSLGLALTLMLVPSTPIFKMAEQKRFELPPIEGLLNELKIITTQANPTSAVFRANHASNYLPIGGRLPRDRQSILQQIDAALDGRIPVREEWTRGL